MMAAYHQLNLVPLPINDCMEELLAALAKNQFAVLVAPPGAGKTTRVPLALLDQEWLGNKKIIMLEPRRLAARSAAHHIASLLNEKPGETIGYRVRMETKVSKNTRLEIVTEGVFTRMILNDPELKDVGAILFDEFHERSLDGDLGLALTIETAGAFRSDLRILPMSATMDGAKVSSILGKAECDNSGLSVPVIESLGRMFPVELRYKSKAPDSRIETEMVKAIHETLEETLGSILCFLPGQGEIERVYQSLGRLPENVELHRLYGAIDQKEQSLAIKPPAANRRKIVLASSIAETSITIDGVTAVIDSGLARVPKYEPSTGLTRLTAVKASKASIAQRAGRAGRTAPGTALRLWHEGQTNSLPDYERPEILEADLTGLALDLAMWGVSDPEQLNWLDAPPAQNWKQARHLLQTLGAIANSGAITDHGKAISALGMPPRLAHMIVKTGERGAILAVMVSERGLGGGSIDLSIRLENLEKDNSQRSQNAKKLARRIVQQVPQKRDVEIAELSVGVLISLAWPERIAKRMGDSPDGFTSFRMTNGRRAKLESVSNLAKEKYIVISDLQGSAASAKIFGAASMSEAEIHQHHSGLVREERVVEFDPALEKFKVWAETKIDTLILSRKNAAPREIDNIAERLTKHLAEAGMDKIFSNKSVANFLMRANFLQTILPDEVRSFAPADLQIELQDWLLPMIPTATSLADIGPEKVLEGLKLRLGFENIHKLEHFVPLNYQLPSGSNHSLYYEDGEVTLRARMQEFFSLRQHPAILDGKLPITLEFLSPAMRPIQKTKDITGFWKGSWSDVKKEMKGRYPKHNWPDDPVSASPDIRTKARAKQS